ncbi:MAG TPA: cyclic nucleotide-binding domain-containing protein [Syntrophales bacterium]|nr:cyclic nucleotide-binding domain-containing protein [Syntrophales bacterium]
MVSVNQLRNYSFFEGFSDAQLEQLASTATEEFYTAGHKIYTEGEPAENFYLLEEGKLVRIKEIPAGSQESEEVNVDFVRKGEVIGWSAFSKPYVYNMGARCIDDSKLIAFNVVKLRELIDKNHISLFVIEQAIWKTKLSRPDDERIYAFSLSSGCT